MLAGKLAIEADAAAAVRSVVERFGGLDILVNNAGVGRGPRDPTVPQATGGLGAEMAAAIRKATPEYAGLDDRGVFLEVRHHAATVDLTGAARSRTKHRTSPRWS